MITFKLGTGVINLSPFLLPDNSLTYLNNDSFFSAAPALATARLTAKIELAPNFPLSHPY